MTLDEELKMHLDKLATCKAELKLAQENWIARNKLFNDWVQKALGVEGHEGELHLSEILTKWDQRKLKDEKVVAETHLATT